MTALTWQLQTPINTIIFDCDGTLSTIEGIDELAKKNGTSEQVVALTAAAMGCLGMNLELYEKRLELVRPTQSDVLELGEKYYTHRVEDADKVIKILKRLQKNIFIVSGGLLPAITIFGEKIHIPKENIIAVDIHFDPKGNYLNFDRASPLVTSTGKRIVISHIKTIHQELIFIGDGLNDLVALDLVNRFIGFGGSFYRKNIADQCQFYIQAPSLSAVLPLSLTQEEYQSLILDERMLYQKGLKAIEKNQVAIS